MPAAATDTTTSDVPRVRPGGLAEVSPIAWLLARAGGVRYGTEPINLFLVLGRHRRLFRGWLGFAARLMPRGRLPRRDTELVILRVAHRTGSTYEWSHHERIGRAAGLAADDLRRLTDDAAAPGWSDRQRALLAATDELLDTGDLADAGWARLREHLDDVESIEFVLLVTHYRMLSTTIRALRIPTERSRAGRC